MDVNPYHQRVAYEVMSVMAGLSELRFKLISYDELTTAQKDAIDILLYDGLITQIRFVERQYAFIYASDEANCLCHSSEVWECAIHRVFCNNDFIQCVLDASNSYYNQYLEEFGFYAFGSYRLKHFEFRSVELAPGIALRLRDDPQGVNRRHQYIQEYENNTLLNTTSARSELAGREKIRLLSEDRSNGDNPFSIKPIPKKTNASFQPFDHYLNCYSGNSFYGSLETFNLHASIDNFIRCEKQRILTPPAIVNGTKMSSTKKADGQTTEKPDIQNEAEKAVERIDGQPITVRERDKWIYEQAMKRIPYSDIAKNLPENFPGEKEIKPERCGQIAREYADEHDQPRPATRKKTKQKRNFPK